MPMRRESGRASGSGRPKPPKKIRKVKQNERTSSLGSNAAAAHGYKPSSSKKPIPKQAPGQRQDLKPRAVPTQKEKETAYAVRMREKAPAEAKRQGDIVRTERALNKKATKGKIKYDMRTGNYVQHRRRALLPDENVVVDPKTASVSKDIDKATKQSAVQHAEVIAPALKVMDQTLRPVRAIAGGTEAALKGKGPTGILKAQKKGLVENKGPLFGKVLRDRGVPKGVAEVAGFGLDTLADPTTYLTGGTGKVAVRAAEKAAKDAAKKAAREGAVSNLKYESVRETKRAAKAAARGVERKPTGVSETGGPENLRRVAERQAAKRAAAPLADKGTGVTVKFAGKEVPGVRRGTAAVGRQIKKAPGAQTVGSGVKQTAAHVRPQIAPEGVARETHQAARQIDRRARQHRARQAQRAVDEGRLIASKLKQDEYAQVVDAVERRKIGSLPEHLRQPAVAMRSGMRAAKRERSRAGIAEGTVGRQRATVVRQPSSSLKAGEKPTKRLTATVTRPPREPGAAREYMPHMREDLIEEGNSAAAQRKRATTVNSSLKREDPRPVSAINADEAVEHSFSTNLPLSQATYKMKTGSVVAQNRAQRELADKVGRDVKIGQKFELKGSEAIFHLQGGKLKEIAKEDFERLNRRTKSGRPVWAPSSRSGRFVVLPKKVVDNQRNLTVDSRTALGMVFDKAQGKWKRVATLSPGFHVRNAVGDTQMGYLAQPGHRLPVSMGQSGKALKRMTQREAHARKSFEPLQRTDKTIKVAGKRQNLDDFLDGAEREGVLRSAMIGRELGEFKHGAEGVPNPKRLKRLASQGKLTAPARKAAAAGRSINRGLQNREDLNRLATYKYGKDKGLSDSDAADLAMNFHIDYGDVTDTERNVLRRAAPFYTFSARALPIHVKALVSSPGKIANIEKARVELANAFGLGEDWEGDVPEWKQRAIPFGATVKGEDVAFDVALPVGMLNEVPVGADPKAYLSELSKFSASLLSPALKIPIETMTNKSLAFRKPIKGDYQAYVAAPTWATKLHPKIKERLGIVNDYEDPRSGKKVAGWDPWTNYAFSQIPGLANQFRQLTTEGSLQSGRAGWQKVAGVAGVKADPIDPKTARITELFEKRRKIQNELNKLNNRGIKGGMKSTNPDVRRLTKELAAADFGIYSNSVQRGDKGPLRESSISNKKLLKPRVKNRGIIKKKGAAKSSSGWSGASSGGSGW